MIIKNLTDLQYLNLCNNDLITNDGIENLVKLQCLNLKWNNLITS